MNHPTAPRRPDALTALDAAGRAALFTAARTASSFTPIPVGDAMLRSVWDLAKWPPTAANIQPLRVSWVRTPEGRERLMRHVHQGNHEKVASAPVTAVLAADTRFHEYTARTLPYFLELQEVYEADPARREDAAQFNASLQIGYFVLAVRAHGLVAGPLGGFDPVGLDADFFPEGRWRSLLLVNVGHPGENAWGDRLPRLDQDVTLRWM